MYNIQLASAVAITFACLGNVDSLGIRFMHVPMSCMMLHQGEGRCEGKMKRSNECGPGRLTLPRNYEHLGAHIS